MVKDTPIKCPKCNKDTGYTQEQFMYYVLKDDVKCPHCGEVVLYCNKVLFNTKEDKWNNTISITQSY